MGTADPETLLQKAGLDHQAGL
ncbi:hypothetical protein OCEANICA350_12837 [Oceanicaulis sp. 350]|nr:hypothetical protein OCEANICA350_12837 [Oceanicaulis sp. 350]